MEAFFNKRYIVAGEGPMTTVYIIYIIHMDYKSRLTNLKLLPLMYIYELTDIFAIKSFKNVQTVLIYMYHSIQNLMIESITRSSNTKLCHKIYSNAITANSYFC